MTLFRNPFQAESGLNVFTSQQLKHLKGFSTLPDLMSTVKSVFIHFLRTVNPQTFPQSKNIHIHWRHLIYWQKFSQKKRPPLVLTSGGFLMFIFYFFASSFFSTADSSAETSAIGSSFEARSVLISLLISLAALSRMW